MQSKNRSCIFEHGGFVYTCDFENMLMWVIQEEDDVDPVTTLEIMRQTPKNWFYRHVGAEPWSVDSDAELTERLEKFYTQYLNEIIVGQNGTQDSAKANRSKRLHQVVG